MATAIKVGDFLAGTALFAATSAATKTLVAAQLKPVAFAEGRTIFSRGDAGSELFLVVQGRVRLQIVTAGGRELSFAHAGPGMLFGEIAALDGGSRTADAVAATAVEAMALGRGQINRLIAAAPDFAASVVRFLCARLRATDDLLESIGLHSIEVRLVRFLLYKVKIDGHGPGMRQAAIEFPYSQTELASLIGASRPKVSLALSALEAAGAIKREPGRVVCDIERLMMRADGPGD